MVKRNLIILISIFLVVFFLCFPKVYKKDNLTYEDAVAKWAKGQFVTVGNNC